MAMDPVEAIWSLADSVRDQTASFNGAQNLGSFAGGHWPRADLG